VVFGVAEGRLVLLPEHPFDEIGCEGLVAGTDETRGVEVDLSFEFCAILDHEFVGMFAVGYVFEDAFYSDGFPPEVVVGAQAVLQEGMEVLRSSALRDVLLAGAQDVVLQS
jgi:hypothetical protein